MHFERKQAEKSAAGRGGCHFSGGDPAGAGGGRGVGKGPIRRQTLLLNLTTGLLAGSTLVRGRVSKVACRYLNKVGGKHPVCVCVCVCVWGVGVCVRGWM